MWNSFKFVALFSAFACPVVSPSKIIPKGPPPTRTIHPLLRAKEKTEIPLAFDYYSIGKRWNVSQDILDLMLQDSKTRTTALFSSPKLQKRVQLLESMLEMLAFYPSPEHQRDGLNRVQFGVSFERRLRFLHLHRDLFTGRFLFTLPADTVYGCGVRGSASSSVALPVFQFTNAKRLRRLDLTFAIVQALTLYQTLRNQSAVKGAEFLRTVWNPPMAGSETTVPLCTVDGEYGGAVKRPFFLLQYNAKYRSPHKRTPFVLPVSMVFHERKDVATAQMVAFVFDFSDFMDSLHINFQNFILDYNLFADARERMRVLDEAVAMVKEGKQRDAGVLAWRHLIMSSVYNEHEFAKGPDFIIDGKKRRIDEEPQEPIPESPPQDSNSSVTEYLTDMLGNVGRGLLGRVLGWHK